ncbi:DUF3100 domain-containing protein [Neobacillus mesonae]|uniref:DUF3100 domain-containing protein n=1 Tax=Neobacillus mesonae TaxID=1193713 RepID=UPI0025746BFF|nr:DUF3100 domain-containing protein [Neobacillus mesonae]MED4202501.1 DUF3100 domain-containing protein [Neobacillus mesonae]
MNLWKDWRLHVVVLGIVIVTELIGTHKVSIGSGVILLLPMLYAIIIGLGLFFTPFVKEKQSKNAETLVFLAVSLLMAKFGVTIGPAVNTILEVGPALILQELGHLATLLIALPAAVLLGLKRESIGMTHSIGREPNVALIMDKYGLNSPEGRGVMSIYIFGTIFGAVFLGLISGILATITPLHPLAFAMASGVGSGSMMAAASGSLVSAFPNLEKDIVALAGASNLISTATGLYVSIFIALPLTEKLYAFLTKFRDKKSASKVKVEG